MIDSKFSSKNTSLSQFQKLWLLNESREMKQQRENNKLLESIVDHRSFQIIKINSSYWLFVSKRMVDDRQKSCDSSFHQEIKKI